jgi:sporulation protein YlmC with PRC-barrel domain
MSTELRLKKLRGSGGYIMASVTDEQQRKGNLGGPDLFLAPVGRVDADKISKYFCNTCEKDVEGSPRIDYENPNELVAENLMLLERGQYICTNCGSVLAEYRSFSKPNANAEIGLAKPNVSAEVGLAKPQKSVSQVHVEPTPEHTSQQTYSQVGTTSGVTTFNSITGLVVYDSEARKIGVVKQIGVQAGQPGIVLVVTKNDGSDVVIRWEETKKVGDIVLLGSQVLDSGSKCNGCGFDNKPDARFCESCGKKIK